MSDETQKSIHRRGLLQATAMGAFFSAIAPMMLEPAQAQSPRGKSIKAKMPETPLVWLDQVAPDSCEGLTFGVPWPMGAVSPKTTFQLSDWPVQTWPTAYWPDGSIKWTAHAIAGGKNPKTSALIAASTKANASNNQTAEGLVVSETPQSIDIKQGDLVWTIDKASKTLIRHAMGKNRKLVGAVTLQAMTQSSASEEEMPEIKQARFEGQVTQTIVESKGPVRVVIRHDGLHRGDGRDWLPFTVRLYFYLGSQSVRLVHSFIFDGDEAKDFISGLSIKADVPMQDALHDRHMRLSGQEGGVWGEAVRPLTGLRRDFGKPVRQAQINGQKVPEIPERFAASIEAIPFWGDVTLSQPNADGYKIKKRTQAGHAFVPVISEHRSEGLAYIGGASGGVALGLKDFWQKAPTRLDIRKAHTDMASVTAWLWSPDAPAMDLRPYRPQLGMDTFEKQNVGLNITYEDYEPGYGRAHGIARTSELRLWALETTPSRPDFAAMTTNLAKPPVLTVSPSRLNLAGVFGAWKPVDRSTPLRARIEDRISGTIDYYLKHIALQRWYGFWDYGDVMHTYDADRHVWRYDIGGFAWDNSELSSDMMFWYAYLRSGRADLFRMAEAMTRHTAEVDVYHLGPWKGFGTRHGVQHFSDSSKQPRVSNAAFKRFYYYLTADERTGDLMRDLNGSDETLSRVFIERKVAVAGGSGLGIRQRLPGSVDCSFGTSWGSFIAAWFTEWERTGNTVWRDRIITGMKSIAAYRYGWFAGGGPYDLKSGQFLGKGDSVSISHLNGVHGVFEIHMEMLDLIDVPAYRQAWLDYCRYYNAPSAEFTAFVGSPPRGRNLIDAHSRFTAYAGVILKDETLKARAWKELFDSAGGTPWDGRGQSIVKAPHVLHETIEDLSISTNGASQWGLAAMADLALIGDTLETLGAPYINKPK